MDSANLIWKIKKKYRGGKTIAQLLVIEYDTMEPEKQLLGEIFQKNWIHYKWIQPNLMWLIRNKKKRVKTVPCGKTIAQLLVITIQWNLSKKTWSITSGFNQTQCDWFEIKKNTKTVWENDCIRLLVIEHDTMKPKKKGTQRNPMEPLKADNGRERKHF